MIGIWTVRGTMLNVHLFVDPSSSDHVERINTLLGRLTFRVDGEDYGRTAAALTLLGRHLNPAIADDRVMFMLGSEQHHKVSMEDLRRALDNAWASENVLVAVAAERDLYQWRPRWRDATMRKRPRSCKNIIFSGNPGDRDFWLGMKDGADVTYIKTG